MKNSIFLLFMVLLYSFNGYSQNYEISGKVIDSKTGEVLIGVSIVNLQTKNGTQTDFDGNFTLSNNPKGSIVEFSYLGYKQTKITIINNETLTISLTEDSISLQEVVLIGYGTQNKKEITGAVSVLDSKSIEKLNPVRIEQAIQGQVAGVNVTSNSGSPGSGMNIRIRGITTNGNNDPLILVDGNRIVDLSVLNPNDIKSINIIKDATAGIYGVQAANGVILITTKSGSKNKELKISLDTFTGFQSTSKKIDLLNPTDFAIYVNDAANSIKYFVYPQQGTNWQDEVFEKAAISSTNLSINGGTEKSAYGLGISYLDQDGIVGGSKNNYNRLTSRINYQYDLLDNLKLTANGLHTLSKKQNLQEGGIGAVLYNAVNINPDMFTRENNGNYAFADKISQIEIINPLAQIENSYNTTKISKFSGVLGLDYTFWKYFNASSKFQINHANVRDDIFRPEVFYGLNKAQNFGVQNDGNITNQVVDNGVNFDDFTWDNYITFNKKFKDVHDLTILLGTSLYRTKAVYYGLTGDTNIGTNQLGQTVQDEGMIITPRFNEAAFENGANWFDVRLSSSFTRLQYSFKEKYLLSAVIRRDVSSQFSPKDGNNIGYFPSGSIGWNLSEESFLKNNSWINDLKIRASFGIIGNDRIDSFAYITRLNGQATIDPGNISDINSLVFGSAEGSLGNNKLKWEEQETSNVGFDLKLLNNKISLTTDFYRKRTKDLLLRPQSSATTGIAAPGSASPFVNAGTVENKGIEIGLGYSDKISEDFSFNFNFNFTNNRNEVLSLNGRTPPVGGEFGVGLNITDVSRMIPGLPLGHFYGYKTDGLYQTQAEIDALNSSSPSGVYSTIGAVLPGDLKFVDINGDGQITADDRTNLGDPIPDFTFGFNLGFTYKNIDFSANAFASVGNEMVRDYERKDLYANRGTYMLDRWQGTGTSNTVPRAVSGANINTDNFSDFFVEDASFLRLQNVQIGYTFGAKQISNLGIEKLRIYVSGNNLYTLTNYLGYDPSANSGAPLGGGIDKGFYPVASSYLLGINLNF